jgi:hypothetical protein
MSSSEIELVNEIISSVEKEKSRLDEGIINGRQVINTLLSLSRNIAFRSKRFEATQSFLYFSLAATLLNTYFEQTLHKSVVEMLNKSDKYGIPAFIRNMFKREVYDLDVDNHFDDDYIPKLEKMKNDFTTLKEYSEVDGAATKLISLLVDCSEPIVREINIKLSRFCEEVINALKEKPSLNTFKEKVEEFIINLHREVHGWL